MAGMDKFIAIIRREMQNQDVSISELARRAKTSRPYLHRVLAKQHIPSFGWCQRIAKALKLKIEIKHKPVVD